MRPFEPSQVTTIRDHSFGLGKNPRKSAKLLDDVIDMVRDKPEHASMDKTDFGEYNRLVPAPPPNLSDADVADGAGGDEGGAVGIGSIMQPAAARPSGVTSSVLEAQLTSAAVGGDESGPASAASSRASTAQGKSRTLAPTRPQVCVCVCVVPSHLDPTSTSTPPQPLPSPSSSRTRGPRHRRRSGAG